jgi:hypothetical protein
VPRAGSAYWKRDGTWSPLLSAAGIQTIIFIHSTDIRVNRQNRTKADDWAVEYCAWSPQDGRQAFVPLVSM